MASARAEPASQIGLPVIGNANGTPVHTTGNAINGTQLAAAPSSSAHPLTATSGSVDSTSSTVTRLNARASPSTGPSAAIPTVHAWPPASRCPHSGKPARKAGS